MYQAEELIGATVSSHLELEEIVHASCTSFRASSSALEAFWGPVGMYAGDFDLVIYRAPVNGGTFADRCSAYCAERFGAHRGPLPATWSRSDLEKAGWLEPERSEEEVSEDGEPPEEPFDWRGLKVGMALWQLGRFERVCWDWKKMNERAGVPTSEADRGLAAFMRTSTGGTFLARIFANLSWSHTAADIGPLRKDVQGKLAALPEPAQGVSRGRFAAMIDEDVERLRALCGDGGVLANGLLADPEAEIMHAIVAVSNGNETRVCLETEAEWFGIDFVTS